MIFIQFKLSPITYDSEMNSKSQVNTIQMCVVKFCWAEPFVGCLLQNLNSLTFLRSFLIMSLLHLHPNKRQKDFDECLPVITKLDTSSKFWNANLLQVLCIYIWTEPFHITLLYNTF